METRDDFAPFVLHLSDYFTSASDKWENPTLDRYLDALWRWTDSVSNMFRNTKRPLPDGPSWGLFARMLLAVVVYDTGCGKCFYYFCEWVISTRLWRWQLLDEAATKRFLEQPATKSVKEETWVSIVEDGRKAGGYTCSGARIAFGAAQHGFLFQELEREFDLKFTRAARYSGGAS